MKSDALLAQWTGTSRSKTERSGQSYGLERSTTALRSKPGKKDRVLTRLPLASKREASLPRMKSRGQRVPGHAKYQVVVRCLKGVVWSVHGSVPWIS